MLSTRVVGDLVWADHLAVFPTAVDSARENPEQGIGKHNPAEQIIRTICSALVVSTQRLVIKDLVTGTANVPGTFVPTPGFVGTLFVFPGAGAAAQSLVAARGWTGREGNKVATSFVTSPLLRVSLLGALVMDSPFPGVGTGVGVVSPASNIGLENIARGYLLADLKTAFEASAYFFEGDDPARGVNRSILEALPDYASALAQGLATIASATTYTGPAGSTTPVGPVPNTGRIL